MWRKRLVTVPRRLRSELKAFGLAAAFAMVQSANAQPLRNSDHGRSAGTGIGVDGASISMSDGLSVDAAPQMGVFVAQPVGRVWIDPESVDGMPSYVRRTKGKGGMSIVEVSATPFMDEVPGVGGVKARPEELPAPW
jgi:hypothetical protein